MNVLTLILTFSLISLISCEENHFREDKVFAGAKLVDSKTLNKGRALYQDYCMACHGPKGDGKGVASLGMKVPPRDFTKGIFKFGRVISGELPHDEDLYIILEKGLHGTAMLPWDLKPKQMDAVVQYIKTFAPQVWEGKDKKLGEPIRPTKDPFGLAHRSAAVAQGKEVYHVVAECWSCHRAYVPRNELSNLYLKINGERETDFDDDLYQAKPQETDWGFTNIPPDFTWDTVRSAKTVEEIYIRLASGVGGTTMPSWKDTLTEEQIWAVSHYVHSLMEHKNSPSRTSFLQGLK